jgi:hypothetical protein
MPFILNESYCEIGIDRIGPARYKLLIQLHLSQLAR